MSNVTVAPASTGDDLAEVRALFGEYASSLGFSLCFQDFDAELASLPGAYAPPQGRLLLARVNSVVAGCVGLRPIEDRVCEMKRLFVRPAFCAQGIGRQLAVAIIKEGGAAGYETMKLDTVPSMTAALGLYTSLGFRDIALYTVNPIAGARYLELRLVG
jgi:ribosomal protein S18 acetylase RimI-like enzyme